MKLFDKIESTGAPNWDAIYHGGAPSWETGRPAAELIRVLGEKVVRPCRVLELGCGTGCDAICLSQHGFEVTAIDSSPMAIERARARLDATSEPVRFVLGDMFPFAQTAGTFGLVYDAGFYHHVRQGDLDRFLDLLWRVTEPGSYYLTLAGNADELAAGGPPRVCEDDIYGELGRLMDVVDLRPFTWESRDCEEGYRGWSCLMRRPVVAL